MPRTRPLAPLWPPAAPSSESARVGHGDDDEVDAAPVATDAALTSPGPFDQVWLTQQQAADLLGVSVRTIRSWQSDPKRPLRVYRFGRQVRIRYDDLIAFGRDGGPPLVAANGP